MRLGDTVEALAKLVGLKACSGCKRRKAILNGMTWKEYRTINPRK